jgi:predicted small lipoprotein YifL
MLKLFGVVILLLLIGLFGCGQRQPVPPAASTDHLSTGEQATLPDSQAGHSNNDAPSTVDHDAHGSHENMPMNMTPPRTLVVMTEPSQPTIGSTTKLEMKIQNPDGTLIKTFDVLHEKLVHLIVVRDGLDEFAHLHPEVDSSGVITTQFAFPKSGKYRLFADHQPQGNLQGLATGEVNVSGNDDPAAPLIPTASPEVAIGELQVHIRIRPGEQEANVHFRFVDADGKPVSDLQPYLGAMGHLVIISADGSEYVHAHPLSEAGAAPDGVVEFAAHFPDPGIYKAWGQFQRNGTVFTVPYVLKHEVPDKEPGVETQK